MTAALFRDFRKALHARRSPDLCDQCLGPITGQPVIDPEQVAWLGKNAPRWCSADCSDNWAEANSLNR